MIIGGKRRVAFRGVGGLFVMLLLGPPIAWFTYTGIDLLRSSPASWLDASLVWFFVSSSPTTLFFAYFFGGFIACAAGLISLLTTILIPSPPIRVVVTTVTGLLLSHLGKYFWVPLSHLDQPKLIAAGGVASLACSAMLEGVRKLSSTQPANNKPEA